MNCPQCTTEMEVYEYYVDFYNNDETVQLREEFQCPNCNKAFTKFTMYKKDHELIEER